MLHVAYTLEQSERPSERESVKKRVRFVGDNLAFFATF